MEEYYQEKDSWKSVQFVIGLAIALLLIFPTQADVDNYDITGGEQSIQDTDYVFINLTEKEIYSECSNLHIIHTAECLKKFVDDIYIYRITPNGEEVDSFEELKSLGGDCLDWSVWMTEIYLTLGFEAGHKRIPMVEPEIIGIYNVTGHEFNWVKDGNIYCIYAGINNPVCGKVESEKDFYKIISSIEDTDDLKNFFYKKEVHIIK